MQKLWIVLLTLCTSASFAAINAPDFRDYYPNPYAIWDVDYADLKTSARTTNWTVITNKARAAIYEDAAGKRQMGTVPFQETFEVLSKQGSFLEVQLANNRSGWIGMQDLIISSLPFLAPSGVRYKAFLRFNIDLNNEQPKREGELSNTVRVRDCPGTPSLQNGCQYLREADAYVPAANRFFYIYGVAFDNGCSAEQQIDCYTNEKYFREADWYLLSSYKSLKGRRVDKKPMWGWMSAKAARFWSTRQAFDWRNDDKQCRKAHVYRNAEDVNQHFYQNQQLRDCEQMQQNTEATAGTIWRFDQGAAQEGLDLRAVLVDEEYQQTKRGGDTLFTAHVGTVLNINEGRASIQRELQDLIEQTKRLEVFFLVDATKSMDSSLKNTAVAIESLKRNAEDAGMLLRIHAGVYRDTSEQDNQYEYYSPGQINDFIARIKCDASYIGTAPCIKAYSDGDADYEEALFPAISQALETLKYDNEFDQRILYVLGDTGDTSPYENINPLAKELYLSGIRFKPIYIDHAATGTAERQINAELVAKGKFINHMCALLRVDNVFLDQSTADASSADFPAAELRACGKAAPLIGVLDLNTSDTQVLASQMQELVASQNNTLGDLRDLFMSGGDFTPLRAQHCYECFNRKPDVEQACNDQSHATLSDFINKENPYCYSAMSDVSRDVLSKLKSMQLEELKDLVYQEGWMPLVTEQNNEKSMLAKPQWLLGYSDLLRIEKDINFIIDQLEVMTANSDCEGIDGSYLSDNLLVSMAGEVDSRPSDLQHVDNLIYAKGNLNRFTEFLTDQVCAANTDAEHGRVIAQLNASKRYIRTFLHENNSDYRNRREVMSQELLEEFQRSVYYPDPEAGADEWLYWIDVERFLPFMFEDV